MRQHKLIRWWHVQRRRWPSTLNVLWLKQQTQNNRLQPAKSSTIRKLCHHKQCFKLPIIMKTVPLNENIRSTVTVKPCNIYSSRELPHWFVATAAAAASNGMSLSNRAGLHKICTCALLGLIYNWGLFSIFIKLLYNITSPQLNRSVMIVCFPTNTVERY